MFYSFRRLLISLLHKGLLPVSIGLSILLFSAPVHAWNGRVLKILAGDTFVVSWKNQSRTIKLYGIDCPGTTTGSGQKARTFTRATIKGKMAKINPMTKDAQGRIVAQVFMNGQSLNAFIVRSGYGLVNKKQCRIPICADWLRYERYAFKRHKGIWVELEKIPQPGRRQGRMQK
jgi:endonuclease YncB( thermonuclease family)